MLATHTWILLNLWYGKKLRQDCRCIPRPARDGSASPFPFNTPSFHTDQPPLCIGYGSICWGWPSKRTGLEETQALRHLDFNTPAVQEDLQSVQDHHASNSRQATRSQRCTCGRGNALKKQRKNNRADFQVFHFLPMFLERHSGNFIILSHKHHWLSAPRAVPVSPGLANTRRP